MQPAIDGGGSHRVFTVKSEAVLKLTHLIIRNGKVKEAVSGDDNGYGGGFDISGNATFIDCIITGHLSESNYYSGGGWGGAFYIRGGNTLFENCIITKNSVSGCGGTCPTNGAGAFYIVGGTHTFQGCIISHNTATTNDHVQAGAFQISDAEITFINSSIVDNTATTGSFRSLGGGICASGSKLTLSLIHI